MRLLLGMLLPLALCADPIMVTLLNQAVQTEARTTTCNDIEVLSASCTSSMATILAGYPMQIVIGTNGISRGITYANASVVDTVLITGGQGTGYLNIDLNYGYDGDISNETVSVNGVSIPVKYGYMQAAVVPFTFGESFSYAVDLNSAVGEYGQSSANLSFIGARIYTTEPTSCFTGLCTDQGYTDASATLGDPPASITNAPEPGTAWLLMAGLIALSILPIKARLRQ